MHYFTQEASEILKHALKWVRNKKKYYFSKYFRTTPYFIMDVFLGMNIFRLLIFFT